MTDLVAIVRATRASAKALELRCIAGAIPARATPLRGIEHARRKPQSHCASP